MKSKRYLLLSLLLTSFSLPYPYKGSGYIYEDYLRHRESSKYIFRVSDSRLRVFLRARQSDVSKAYLVYLLDDREIKLEMSEIGSTRGKQYFYVDFDYDQDSIEYYFIVEDGKLSITFRSDESNFKYNIPFYYRSERDDFNSLLWYQIAVDRFRSGNPNGSECIWTDSWRKLTKEEQEYRETNSWYDQPYERVYGGDLQGIMEKLNYLQNLGVDVILLSPIFLSTSNHKHDVLNHLIISPDISSKEEMLDINSISLESSSSDELFAKLAEEVHKRGMKLVVEFPLTTSRDHFAFKDVMLNRERSEYFDWYLFDKDMSYLSSDEEGLLPLLNLSNSDVWNYLRDSLSKYMLLGLDGVVLNNVQDPTIISQIESLGLFVANMPFNSENQFNQYSATFNFRVLSDLIKVIESPIDSNVTSLITSLKLNELRSSNSRSVIAPLSTIDSERLFSAFVNAFEKSSKLQENSRYKVLRPDIIDRRSVKYVKMALTLISSLNSLMIAYGDELGLWGGSDPDSKRPMIWPDLPFEDDFDDLFKYSNLKGIDVDEANDRAYFEVKENREIEDYFHKLLSMRRENIELFQIGRVIFPKVDRAVSEDLLVVGRVLDGVSVIIVLNLSSERVVTDLPTLLYTKYVDIVSGKVYKEGDKIKDFEIAPLESVILFSN